MFINMSLFIFFEINDWLLLFLLLIIHLWI